MNTPRWSALLALLVACSGDDGTDDKTGTDTDTDTDTDISVPSCTDDGITAFEVGAGELAFVALNDGGDVGMVHGPQGGWHIEAAGLLTGTSQEVSVLPSLVIPGMGDLMVAGDQQAQFLALAGYDSDTCTGEFYGVRTFLDDVVTPPMGGTYQEFICDMAGPAVLSITVEDIATGASATEQINITLTADPTDPC